MLTVAEVKEIAGVPFPRNTRMRFRLAEYQGETGNVVIDGLHNSATTQTLSITGTPTGGTFTLTWNSVTTGAIAYNATALTVQTALTLAGLRGTVTCTGGPLPGTLITIVYSNAGNTNVLTSTDSLTGGTSPATALAQTAWSNGPVYFMAGGSMYATNTEAARGYVDEPIFWSGKESSFVRQRLLEKTAVARTQIVKGRLKVTRDNTGSPPTGGVLSVAWVDLTGSLVDALVTTSAINMQMTVGEVSATTPEAELTGWNEPANGNYALPALAIADVGGHTQITVTFGVRQTVMASMVTSWTYAAVSTPMNHYYLPWVPVDQSPNVRSTRINLGIVDFRLLAGHVIQGGGPGVSLPIVWDDILLYDRNGLLENQDILYLDLLCFLQPTREDTTTL